MSGHRRALALVLLCSVLVGGCRDQGQPSQTPDPLTATAAAVGQMPGVTAAPAASDTARPAETPSSAVSVPSPTAARSPDPIQVSGPQVLAGHTEAVSSLAFSPDRQLLASTGQDHTVRLWDVATGREVQVLDAGSHSVQGIDWSPDGSLLATIEPDQTIALWDVGRGQVTRRIEGPGLQACGLAFSPDGTLLASGHVHRQVRLWDVATGDLVRTLGGMEGLTCPLDFSPDGRWLASGGGNTDTRVLVWEVATGELLHQLSGHNKNVYRVVFSPDGTLLASASGDRTGKIWDVYSGQLLHDLDADRQKLMSVAYSPDGQWLVSGGDDGRVRLWNVDSGELTDTLRGHTREIYAVAFSPVDWVFASAGEGGEAYLWRVSPGAEPAPPAHTPQPPTPVAQSPIPSTEPYDKIPEERGDGWQTASVADVGIDPVWMTKMLESIYTGEQADEPLTMPGRGSKVLGIHDVLIVRDGRLVFEEYFYFKSPYSKHEVASVTKSFTSLLVGLAIEQGYLESVDEKIVTFFPEYLPLEGAAEQVEEITIEDLLTMRHGWECDDHDPASRTYYGNDHPLDRSDLVETILYFPMENSPGESFSYCTSGTYVLNAILTKATGMNVSSFAQQVLFDPLGIESVTWIPFWGGWDDIAGVQYMHPRDLAKIGLMVLQNGKWEGEQVVPEEWIRRSTQAHSILEPDRQPSWGRGYGYLWWLGDPRVIGTSVQSICALGGWQQVIAIFPELDMVVVINGGDDAGYAGQVYQIMENYILPAVLGY